MATVAVLFWPEKPQVSDSKYRIAGLYGIVDTGILGPEKLLDATSAALDGGVRVIQYRDKGTDRGRRWRQARALAMMCRNRGACFIVNDDITLAVAVVADGVHIGMQDASIAEAREQLGPSAIIGVSCYNSLDKARNAAVAGADYVAFGSFFPSSVKPDAVCAEPDLLTQARASLSRPIVAIGGITAANGATLVAAGADALAVISSLFTTADSYRAAIELSRLFSNSQYRNPQ